MTKEDIHQLAILLTGTQVPRSMGMLGTAMESWDFFWQALHLNGWHSVEEVELALTAYLGAER